MPACTLMPVNAGVYQLLDATGQHVGNIKCVAGRWKFKAVGYAAHGEVVPGGGPLTHHHNLVFARLDADGIAVALGLQPDSGLAG